ncbi:mechanosensitive ion channel domain-containing protein [Desulfoluna spongiiphila]|uniref:Mechanosensitive ion channel n=1 Tax=Desulfoluna spongiiphila TaxID=419481 RepID=A0A1G5GZZ5_9BACT|nr:mechanosensitive ion channel domain-containing protein [Desulfoluna spongiiphila]SCY57175.1 Mechanosensitive ion channel [Desulfoluna spongiiphila]VVS94692.1 mechanosensitive ion channel mscs [Desulfoluna spongiiphila]
MLNTIAQFMPFVGTVVLVGATLWAIFWLLIGRHSALGDELKFPRQLILLGLAIIGVLVTLLVLPVSENARNQLIGFMGILISGVLAFSSTTITSNLMAGVLLRITKPFRVGDFIRVGDNFGRVSERGLFDTEIQTETRDLIALPNTYFINNPVTTTRNSGTIISATLSLGYDVNHLEIKRHLTQAAQACDLEEPFVHILELGDFSITYRLSGFLGKSKHLISERSNLYGSILDTLHAGGIEIMSPSYMNQKKLRDETRVIPPARAVHPPEEEKTLAEDIAFDKAEKAEELERQKQMFLKEIEELESSLNKTTDESAIKKKKDAIETNRKRLKLLIETSRKTKADTE